MANVLSTLFGNIADAIRGKTGETGKMKPADFPAKIAAIVAGGGGSSSGNFTIKSGGFSAESESQVVQHGCGEVPDVLLVYPSFAPSGGEIVIAVGFSQAMHNALGGGYIAPTSFLLPNGGLLSVNASHGIEGSSVDSEQYGAPRNATSSTFKVGGPSAALKVGGSYNVLYICGIV